MPNTDQASAGKLPSVRRFLRVFEDLVLIALIYSIGAFVAGWVMGGPDMLDGQQMLATKGPDFELPQWLRGVILSLALVSTLVALYLFTPKPNAWLTRLAQSRGLFLTIMVLVGVAIGLVLAFLFLLRLTGSPLFLEDLLKILFGGILGGGSLQLIAAAVLPNPHSKQEQKALQYLIEKTRREAEKLGLDPDEEEDETRRRWAGFGQDIGTFMQFLHGLLAALVGGGVHGGLLFVVGASFFVGLGFGVTGSAVSLFYVVPVLVALADTATLFVGNRLVSRAKSARIWAAVLCLPVGLPGVALKAAILIVSAVVLHRLGGPEVPWRLYADAAFADPLGQGLTVTILLLVGLAWPLLLFVGPVHRDLGR